MGFHKQTVFTVLIIVVILFVLYHFLVGSKNRKGDKR